MEAINEKNLSISELQDQSLQLTTVDQVVELDANELDSIDGGGFFGGLVGGVLAAGITVGLGGNARDAFSTGLTGFGIGLIAPTP
jgi:glutamate synthase domain-containing protein 3